MVRISPILGTFPKESVRQFLFAKQKASIPGWLVFADLGLHSGKYRCFVIDLTEGRMLEKGLVTHGSGRNGLATGERLYSNQPNSYLSSLGRYRIAGSYFGQFGLAYKLLGLDSSNSNAYKRFIVLHGHECVSDIEMEDLICQSWGCPTVSPSFLKTLQRVIENRPLPVLLWVYDSSE